MNKDHKAFALFWQNLIVKLNATFKIAKIAFKHSNYEYCIQMGKMYNNPLMVLI